MPYFRLILFLFLSLPFCLLFRVLSMGFLVGYVFASVGLLGWFHTAYDVTHAYTSRPWRGDRMAIPHLSPTVRLLIHQCLCLIFLASMLSIPCLFEDFSAFFCLIVLSALLFSFAFSDDLFAFVSLRGIASYSLLRLRSLPLF